MAYNRVPQMIRLALAVATICLLAAACAEAAPAAAAGGPAGLAERARTRGALAAAMGAHNAGLRPVELARQLVALLEEEESSEESQQQILLEQPEASAIDLIRQKQQQQHAMGTPTVDKKWYEWGKR